MSEPKVSKLFTTVICNIHVKEECLSLVGLFEGSLMYVVKVRNLPRVEHFSGRLQPNLQTLTRLERLAMDKHSSLF